MRAAKTLVLNADYQAIGVIPNTRAFALVMQNKCDLVANSTDHKLRSAKSVFEAPSIIRLKHYVVVPYRKAPLNRLNVYRRDNYQCQYCGSNKNLTLDHVLPKAKGGRDTWENLVTACKQCNTWKGDKLLSELPNMSLKNKPSRPSFIMFLKNVNGRNLDEKWKPYLYM